MTQPGPPALTARTIFDDDLDHAVVTVSGELDLSTAPGLYEALAEAVDRHPHELTVDLAEPAFIDSSGLTLSLASPTPPVRRVLEIVGLDHLLVA